jgi:photosystem II stability/assembly factor-like uncharacterized protein
MRRPHRSCVVFAAFVICLFSPRLHAQETKEPSSPFQPLKFRSIGPATGGRVSRAAGVPGDPLTYYAATASGGVWKSSDGGVNWKSVFDDQPIASIGSIAIAPSDPNLIYVGSGEANIRGNVAPGNGIYKSLDAGKTWKHVWKQEGQIGTMIVHPTNPDVACAAVLGHAFAPNPERGVYRTKDGGQSWQKVLFKSAEAGASDVCFDPSNPNILFAGTWQARRRPWELVSGGPGSGLWMSKDGGDTWKQLGGAGIPKDDLKGLPEGIYGKVCVAVAPSDGRRVYAMIEAENGGLYRSDDGGEKWRLIHSGKYLRQRAWYFSTVHVDPTNPDIVWCPNVRLLRSIDGGVTFKQVKGTHHPDHHDLWIDPKNPKRMIDSNDGGVDVTLNGGETWYAPPLPISQFYHIAVDTRTPYRVFGCMQDLGSISGPSNSLTRETITLGQWYEVGGGEAGHAVADPTDPDIVYAGEYGGYVSRYDHRTRQARNISVYPTNPSGKGAGELKYRFQWTAPLLISPHDPKKLYHGGNVLFATLDAGQRWLQISPDLTRNDPAKQRFSGGPLTGDNTGAEYYCTIFALAESPKQQHLIWAGTDDGHVYVSPDGHRTWHNVTANISGMPEWGTVACIEASPHDAGTAYVVVDNHRMDDMRPYLFKTSDLGKTWKSLTAKLPQDIYLHAAREDPKKKGLLYAGTERGIVFSADDGATWQSLKLNFPTVAVHDLVVKDNDLVVGTHGRSVWILDDLTPLRELTPAIQDSSSHLFTVAPAIRWRYSSAVDMTPGKQAVGDNPPPGASINYWLKDKPKDELVMEIYTQDGQLVNRLTSDPEPEPQPPGAQPPVNKLAKPKKKIDPSDVPEDDPDTPWRPFKRTVLPKEIGVNRVAWDLCYQGATPIPNAKIDAGQIKIGPLVTPGTYTLRLTVDGKTHTQELKVLPDPRVQVPPEVLAEQLRLALGLRADLNEVTQTVVQIRAVRQQLLARELLLEENDKTSPLLKASADLLARCDSLEEKLHNPKAQVAYDILAMPGGARLYSKLGSLFEWVKDADGKPTLGMKEVYAEFTAELRQCREEWKKLQSVDLAELNAMAKKLDVPHTVVPAGKPR